MPENYGEDSFSDLAYMNTVPDVVYVGRGDGSVCFIDLRANHGQGVNHYNWRCNIHPGRVNSLQRHPTNEHLLLTSGAKMNGYIAIHDLRKQGSNWKPLLTLRHHSKSINGMACSPDGQYIISVSQDNTIRAYINFTNNEKDVITTKISHDNHTGRWLSTFRPIFDLKTPNTFAIGSMERPRQIDIYKPNYNNNTNILSIESIIHIKHDYLASVCSRNAIHNTMNIIAGGNSSGRVHILR